MGEEGLERFSYYSIKTEVLDKSAEQVVANTVANPTLSETVALLIESWSRMTPRQKAWVSTLLPPGKENRQQGRQCAVPLHPPFRAAEIEDDYGTNPTHERRETQI